jgi:DNA-binding response OmpR family regulator
MPKASSSDEKKTVLIVEDSMDFASLLQFIVEDDGFRGVIFPVTQEDILSSVQEHKPAVILMDLALRRKGGMDYINDLKADATARDIPVIVITGRDLGPREIADLQMRNVRYLRKGRVEMHEIRREIRNAVLARPPAGGGL